MDSCSDLCQLITTAPSLSFISLAENLFSLRSVGYFMTAVMERQNTKNLGLSSLETKITVGCSKSRAFDINIALFLHGFNRAWRPFMR